MPFPVGPSNGQVAIVNNISYTWNSTKGAWLRTPSSNVAANLIISNTFTALVGVTGNVIVTANSSTSNTAIGYLSIPQNLSPGSNYTIQLTDQGKHIYLPLTGNANVIYIPTSANVPFPIGSAVNIVVNGAYQVSLTPNTGVTLYLGGNTSGPTGARTLGSYSVSSLLCVAANTWYITGGGIT